jgi:hypothetical protein
MGAFTFDKDFNGGVCYEGDDVVFKGTLTGSASYATGGDSFGLAAEVGLKALESIEVDAGTAATDAGRSLKLAGTAGVPLIKVYTSGAETAATTNLSAVTWKVRLRGKQ